MAVDPFISVDYRNAYSFLLARIPLCIQLRKRSFPAEQQNNYTSGVERAVRRSMLPLGSFAHRRRGRALHEK